MNDEIHDDDGFETNDRFRAIAEKIQVGDAEEGAEALRELVQDAQAGRRSVRDELGDLHAEAQNQAALDRFSKRYKKVVDDPHLVQVSLSILQDEMITDLKAAGVKEEHLAPARGNIAALSQAHSQARRKGMNVRSADDLLEETGRTLSRKFGVNPAPARTPQETVENMRRVRGYGAVADGSSGISSERVQSARAARGPVYQAGPRRVQPTASSEETQRERRAAYMASQRKVRGFADID